MNVLSEVFSGILVVLGALLMLVSSIGILRLPDFYSRLSAVTKNSTIGIVLIIAGAIFHFNNIEVLLKGIGIVFFIALTSPTSAYIIGKAAIHIKVPFWWKTIKDEFDDLEDGISDREKELAAKAEHKRELLAKKRVDKHTSKN